MRRRALLSVSNKTGLVEFARGLIGLNFELISTGGTATTLRDAGLPVVDVAAVTGFPEIMDGRVKTLHPNIHGGLLGRTGIDDDVAQRHGIEFIDLVAVNLYPFREVIANPNCAIDDAIENIDIGGPAMLRAAAKNHARVTIVVDTQDYDNVLGTLSKGDATLEFRRRLAAKAYAHTAQYDAAISNYLAAQDDAQSVTPATLLITAEQSLTLRYGENPHQQAALYNLPDSKPGAVANAAQLQGKELSYNNIADADAAVQCVKSFDACACVIVKHANPCGVAISNTPEHAYQLAYECDSTSAFGGIIAFNKTVDVATAKAIVGQQFAEVIVAPSFDAAARETLSSKPNIRVLELTNISRPDSVLEIKSVEAALLVQQRDVGIWDDIEPRVVTQRAPSERELADLRFAWTVAKYVKSNAIVYAANLRTVGIGAGQMSRVDSARIAALKADEAKLRLTDAAMASDAFFPFRDAVDAAAERGIRAIVQPGGAMRDQEIIDAADEHRIAMVFTGMRHFRH